MGAENQSEFPKEITLSEDSASLKEVSIRKHTNSCKIIKLNRRKSKNIQVNKSQSLPAKTLNSCLEKEEGKGVANVRKSIFSSPLKSPKAK